MALTKSIRKRKFIYKDKDLGDFPLYSEKEVIKMHAMDIPELINSTFEYKGEVDGIETYLIINDTGKKG